MKNWYINRIWGSLENMLSEVILSQKAAYHMIPCIKNGQIQLK